MEKGVPIRSISRCISVLQAINRSGSLTMMEIAHSSNVPYPTACRIVQTLLFEGLIEKEPARKRYRATALVQSLSHGFQDHDRLVTTARQHIVALTKKLTWPVSLATRVGSVMMIRDSTHALTSLTFNNYFPGYTLPILDCASGRAYLTYTDEETRASILEALVPPTDSAAALRYSLARSGALFDEIRANGYASTGRNKFTATPGKTSSIAVPVFDAQGIAGALVLIFFASAIKMNEAITLYVDELKATANTISQELRQPLPPERAGPRVTRNLSVSL
jgi:IclR family mhp operon transcriptional activator